MASAAVAAACGDALMQRSGRPPHDWQRTARFASFGALVAAPLQVVWYSKILEPRVSGVWTKLMLDTAFFGPTFTAAFLMGMTCLEGRAHEALRVLRDRFQTVWTAQLAFWPAAQALNFALVPPRLRVPVVQMYAVVWNAILSYLQYGGCAKQ